MQIVFVVAATWAMWPLVGLMRRGEWASVFTGVVLAGLIGLTGVVSYLLLGRWRVRYSGSILAR